MLRYPYLFSLPYKLIRDVLKKIQDKGMISQDLLQGIFRGKGKVSCWFSGSVVFRNALLLCGVCALASQTLWCQSKQEGNSTGRRKVGQGTVGLGDRDKRREGVTRLIKLFYQSKLQNLQVRNFILNKIFSNQIKLYT